ncbi:hypothetical protein [Leifsonia sp. NPDC058248]|uniref:hypothetical protein n=1 Tax=Leifsonia sp. NPDC058248 TaxID=3346402 RepID=UPI0036D7A127
MRRPAAVDRRGVLILIPRDSSGDLPVWHPSLPRDGWTPADVFDGAHSYAVAVSLPSDVRRVTKVAYAALMRELPEVKRAENVERLSGVDRFRDTFDARAQLDTDDDLHNAPF